jgi:nitroreductase
VAGIDSSVVAGTDLTESYIEFLRTLRSVRTFTDEPVPDEVVDDVLKVARWSGSSVNTQPWELIVVRDRETLQTLASLEGYAGHLAGAALGIVILMAGAVEEDETWDEGKLSERIMLAAWAHGVGSCVGWLEGSGSDRAKELLGVPTERVLRATISLGYPSPEARIRTRGAKARKPLSEIVHYERFGRREQV